MSKDNKKRNNSMLEYILCLWHRVFRTSTCYGCSLISIRKKNMSDEVYECDHTATEKEDE